MKVRSRIDTWLVLFAVLGMFAFFSANAWFNLEERSTTDTEPIQRPSANIGKQQAESIATSFVARQFDEHAKQTYVTMKAHQDLHGYLQMNRLTTAYTRNFGTHFPLHYYRVEVGLTDETIYEVNVHMESGDVVSWTRHTPRQIPNRTTDQFQSDLTQDTVAAMQFLRTRGFDPADWRQGNTTSANGGHTYVFDYTERIANEARLQVVMEIEHGKVIGYGPRFLIPPADLAWMEQQNETAGRLGNLHLWMNLLLFLACIGTAIRYRKTIHFQHGIVLALVFLLLQFMHQINMYTAYRAAYPLGPKGAVYAANAVVVSQLYASLLALFVYLAFVAARPLMRGNVPDTRPYLSAHASSILLAMARGYLLALLILGLQQFMYGIGHRFFNVWSVEDPLFSMHNLLWPFLYPLLAWAAAISEEAIYRRFAIPLLQKLVKSTFLAVLLSSILWAIGHTAYPVYPAYTRLVEVAILGLLFAWIWLRFGFTTSVFAHATVNSILMGLNLLIDPQAANMAPQTAGVWALFYMLSPALLAVMLYAYRLRRKPHHPASG